MKTRKSLVLVLPACLLYALAPPVRAALPVIDVSAVGQLVSQLRTLQSQLATARDQLTEARSTLTALSGSRGMEQLLQGVPRNYLPASWQEMAAALQNAGSGFGALAGQVQTLVAERGVLSAAQLAALTPAQQQLVAETRQQVAALAVVARTALSQSSQRFATLQQLIAAIATATDAKAIYDLQARVQAEGNMLQNEATKLQALFQAQSAQRALLQQQAREQGIADAGSLRNLPSLALR